MRARSAIRPEGKISSLLRKVSYQKKKGDAKSTGKGGKGKNDPPHKEREEILHPKGEKRPMKYTIPGKGKSFCRTG